MSHNEVVEIIRDGFSMNDISIKIYGYSNARSLKKLNKFITENNIDISHFRTKNKNRKYQTVERKCPICKKEFEVLENQDKQTCSYSCANRYFRKNRTEEEKMKISESLLRFNNSSDEIHSSKKRICVACQSMFDVPRLKSKLFSKAKTCSVECKKQLLKNIANQMISSGEHKGWQSRNIESYPEAFFRKVLENNKIPYEFNKPVKKRDLEIQAAGNYFLDFYLPECNIDLEIDGKQHSYAERVEKDKLRDEAISNYFIIYRIVWKSINSENGKKYIEQEIHKFINFYNEQKTKTKKI